MVAIGVVVILSISCAITILCIVFKPCVTVKVFTREFNFDTFAMGALLGPVGLFVWGYVDVDAIFSALQGVGNIEPLAILVLFFSMAFMSISLDESGFFKAAAQFALRQSSSSYTKLFLYIYAVTAVLTVFTSNDIVVLTFTPFLLRFSRVAGVDPLPLLLAEFFAANTYSTFLIMGNPTNILLATALDISFVEFVLRMAVPTLVAGISSFLLLALLFRSSFSQVIDNSNLPTTSPWDSITSKTDAITSVAFLSACLVGLAIMPYFGLSMWKISALCAAALFVVLLVRDLIPKRRVYPLPVTIPKQRKSKLIAAVTRLPWMVIPFVLSLFISVEALRLHSISKVLQEQLLALSGTDSRLIQSLVFGYSSALTCNLINNIPMSVLYASLLDKPGAALPDAIFGTIMGSNLGALLTPIGSLAGILFMGILQRFELKTFSFAYFIKMGFAITPIAMGLGLLTIAVMPVA